MVSFMFGVLVGMFGLVTFALSMVSQANVGKVDVRSADFSLEAIRLIHLLLATKRNAAEKRFH